MGFPELYYKNRWGITYEYKIPCSWGGSLCPYQPAPSGEKIIKIIEFKRGGSSVGGREVILDWFAQVEAPFACEFSGFGEAVKEKRANMAGRKEGTWSNTSNWQRVCWVHSLIQVHPQPFPLESALGKALHLSVVTFSSVNEGYYSYLTQSMVCKLNGKIHIKLSLQFPAIMLAIRIIGLLTHDTGQSWRIWQ